MVSTAVTGASLGLLEHVVVAVVQHNEGAISIQEWVVGQLTQWEDPPGSVETWVEWVWFV
jgi:hypothetical protein